jgi:hypothetical protein
LDVFAQNKDLIQGQAEITQPHANNTRIRALCWSLVDHMVLLFYLIPNQVPTIMATLPTTAKRTYLFAGLLRLKYLLAPHQMAHRGDFY